jgi:hypothetical protein
VNWRPLEPPRAATLAVARGRSQARLLARHLSQWEDELLAPLRGVGGAEVLAVFGAEGTLPWVPGLVYLGRSAAAPRLYLPTLWTPTVPEDILAGALLPAHAGGPVAVAHDPPLVIGLAKASRLDRHRLESWR